MTELLNPVVEVEQGKLRGITCDDVRGGKFYSFLNIPYAKPPVGDLRFKAPVAVKSWPGILDATQGTKVSIQENPLTKQIEGSEDCLILNIYTPCLPPKTKLNKNALKPVMVFIHGGSFLSGSNRMDMHGPEILITEDVVIVAINYRLGILGFLSLDDGSLNVPGNAAFKDMVLALKWIQKNIHNFTGNPGNVTIFGNSAGAAAVHFLVLSPMAKGLFHKAICQSGSALSSWAYSEKNSKSIGRAFGLTSASEKEILKYLQNAPAEEIFHVQKKIDEESIKCNRFRFIGAVVEPSSFKGEKFFSKHPLEILRSGNYNKVPLLMGYNSGDGMLVDGMVDPKLNYIYWTDKEYNVPGLLHLEKGSLLSKQLGDEIIRFYFGNGNISRETHVKEFYDITTDNSFLRGIYSSIQYHRRTSNEPVFMYRLSLESDLCFYKKILQIELPGVCHVDELGYLFKTFFTETPSLGSVEDIAQRRMCRLWTNFAKYSNPTPFADPLLGVLWEPVTDVNNIPFLDIWEYLRMERNPEHERMKFWDKIYAKGVLTSKF